MFFIMGINLTQVHTGYRSRYIRCNNCGFETQEDFEFCPKKKMLGDKFYGTMPSRPEYPTCGSALTIKYAFCILT